MSASVSPRAFFRPDEATTEAEYKKLRDALAGLLVQLLTIKRFAAQPQVPCLAADAVSIWRLCSVSFAASSLPTTLTLGLDHHSLLVDCTTYTL